ncbi:ABC transporter ATP-binding protein [Pseudochrobactrum sp. MP213Fo]|uniref:ABC transporter ATP-binding protein n=1 Tax=Pseudochrobactrum sp. MP213Fo TaxID=3022250 RepID=UPI003B9F6FEA
MNNPFIRFDKVSKAFGSLTVVDNLDLSIQKGEFVSMLGPSGSGKTTLLMLLAGFERPTGGTVSVDGKRIDQLPPHKRNMGVVFQNYALFPHMTIAENVAFPLKMRNISTSEIQDRVKRVLDMVQLGAMLERKPSQLSGGQQQRVALARALVFEPEVVLMDEPLGALDKQLRERMQLDIRELHHRLGLTIVFVTHDQSEALTMSDRIAVFNRGKIEQIGTPSQIYDHPSSQFVAEFIGETNLLNGKVSSQKNGLMQIRLANGQDIHVDADAPLQSGQDIRLSLRPERLRLNIADTSGNNMAATVRDIVYHGDHLRVVLDFAGQSLITKADRHFQSLKIADQVTLSFAPADCWPIAAPANNAQVPA